MKHWGHLSIPQQPFWTHERGEKVCGRTIPTALFMYVSVNVEEMSKLSTDISHRKKIQQNLNNIDEKEQKNWKEQLDKMKNKMAEIQENRNKKLEGKVKTYRQNDEKWNEKLKQIQNKFKEQNRQALAKAQKYRDESQNYWKKKEKRLQQIQKVVYQNSKVRRNQISDLNRSQTSGIFISKSGSKNKQRATYNPDGTILNSKLKSDLKLDFDIDEQIQLHRLKSDNLQKQKETIMFQKAMEKLDKINSTRLNRQKTTKQRQSKVSTPTKPKFTNMSHNNTRNIQKQRSQKRSMNATHQPQLTSKQPLENLIKQHLLTKQRLQQKQFFERGQILQNNLQKSKKDRILKMVKSRVRQMRVNALMKTSEKNKLIQ